MPLRVLLLLLLLLLLLFSAAVAVVFSASAVVAVALGFWSRAVLPEARSLVQQSAVCVFQHSAAVRALALCVFVFAFLVPGCSFACAFLSLLLGL